MKIIVCPDSFKGTMTAIEAAQAIKQCIIDVLAAPEVVLLPVGDGGEGTAESIALACKDTVEEEVVTVDTMDPLRRHLKASYHIMDFEEGRTALIESAAASGLTLVDPKDRDIMRSDTYGTGLLIADAYRRGIRSFMIGMGGTATCDAGWGAYQALRDLKMPDASFSLLCDVENPLAGPHGAAAVFAPQKGATDDQIPLLDNRLRARAEEYRKISGVDTLSSKYAGAAGGLAAMFMALYGATPFSGIQKVLELTGFRKHLEDADLLITGEGRADVTTLSGKAPKGILDAARERGVPVALIGGKVMNKELLQSAGFSHVLQATPDKPDPSISPADYLTDSIRRLFLKTIKK